MGLRLAGHRDLPTSPVPSMSPNRASASDDDARVPAASPSHMERDMMRLLDKAQRTVEGSVPAQVCGLKVRFSLEGDADVVWDIRTSPEKPAL